MAHAISKCHAEETAACCCVDVGTVMDNTDCTASYSHLFSTQAEAEQMLQMLTKKVRSIESEPSQINSQLVHVDQGVQLDAHFTFACQAEALIFQLSLR